MAGFTADADWPWLVPMAVLVEFFWIHLIFVITVGSERFYEGTGNAQGDHPACVTAGKCFQNGLSIDLINRLVTSSKPPSDTSLSEPNTTYKAPQSPRKNHWLMNCLLKLNPIGSSQKKSQKIDRRRKKNPKPNILKGKVWVKGAKKGKEIGVAVYLYTRICSTKQTVVPLCKPMSVMHFTGSCPTATSLPTFQATFCIRVSVNNYVGKICPYGSKEFENPGSCRLWTPGKGPRPHIHTQRDHGTWSCALSKSTSACDGTLS